MVGSHSGRRLALLVANDTYHVPGLAPLFAPVHDAEQLREVLRDPEVGGFQSSELLINESKSEIERTAERVFRGAGPDDVVLFYFSGHGLRTRQNLHLAASNTDHDLLSSTAVSSTFLKELIRDSAAAAKILLLDCCYSGAFLGPDALKSTVRADDVGDQLAAGEGTCVLTASSAIEVAEDGAPGAEQVAPLSVFTSAVVKGLGTGLADNGTGRISPHDLWRYVHAEVRSRTTRQTPSHYGFVKDEIYIARVRRRFSATVEASDRLRLGGLLGRLVQDPEAGLHAADWFGSGRLAVPIGQERRPDAAPGEVVWLDLAGGDSNVLAVGRAGTGKSTFLRSLVGALAVTHTPEEAQVYVLESSNRLGSMGSLPHVVEVVGDDEPGRVSATLARIAAEINRRKKLYRAHNIDSPASLRAVRRSLPGESVPDLFLVVDRWGDFAGLVPELEQTVANLAGAGPEYGIHVVATARDWRDVPDWLADLLSAHIELRLHRPEESRVDAERAAQLPDGPGWALYQQRRFRIAVPDVRDSADEPAEPADTTDGAAELVARVIAASPRPHGPPKPPLSATAAATAAAAAPPPPWRDSGAPLRGPQPDGGGPVDLASLLGIADPRQLDLATLWQPPSDRARLRLPFAVDGAGRPVELDLKESAQDGMGPHGLLVGATGSGKSELLRTLVLGLATTHAPELLNFLLVDFKGGATFAPLDGLPHVAATVSNLAEELTQVDRLSEALHGELLRRQEVLRAAGNLPTHAAYDGARRSGVNLDPLPALVVMIDEFSELLTAKPDFVDILVSIGRLGRALGMHLVLATQRLEEGKLRGLDSHLSFRIGLRTFSAAESRGVLGVPDAYELPGAPGHGYLKAGLDEPVRFRAAYVSGTDPESLLDLVVPRLAGRGSPAYPVWVPPLRESSSLDALLPPLERDPALGLTVTGAVRGVLRAPVGVIDQPSRHRREPYWLDLSGAGGHLLVTGAPRSGKSTLLQGVIASLALTHTPEEVQFYCLDLGGGGLAALAGLPHVGSVANLSDGDRVRRTVTEIRNLLQRREELFAEARITSMEQYRQARRAGQLPSDGYGDVFLVVDGWGTLRNSRDDLDAEIAEIASRGLGYGVHVLLTASRAVEVRASMKSLIGSQIELRLADPFDSEIDRKAAVNVPSGAPGRGLTQGKDQFLAALPRIDGGSDPVTVRDGVDDLCAQVQAAWPGQPAAPVRMLPDELPYDVLLAQEGGGDGVTIGVDGDKLLPVAVDFAADPHFLVFGAAESGKSNLLRVLVRQIARQHPPEQAKIVIVDYRRSLIDCDGLDNVVGYGFNAQRTESLLDEVAEEVSRRLPPADATAEQLQDRGWWTGPEHFVVVDDYDLVVTSEGNPLRRLVDLVGHARDIGLHLVVARASGGAGRSLFEPVLARIRDLGSPGVLLSGDRDEGALLGTVRPERLPPGRGQLVTRREGNRLIQTALLR